MFKLLRLAIYAIVGYAVYTFVTDVVNATRPEEQPKPRRGGRRPAAASKPVPMTGANRGGGAGKPVETLDNDGGTVRHRVGRGVI